jgi:hypothetical protein
MHFLPISRSAFFAALLVTLAGSLAAPPATPPTTPGTPAEHAVLQFQAPQNPLQRITYREWAQRTRICDERGQCVWEHEPLPDDSDAWHITIGTHRQILRDVPTLTVHLTPYEMHHVTIGGTLTGRLLLSDGTPARGWAVTAGGLVVSVMSGHTPSVAIGYGPGGLQVVDADGNFKLDMTDDTLAVVSPEGVPLLYYVQPRNWEHGTNRVVLTLPKTRTVERGQVVDESGKPMPGIRVSADVFFTEGCNSFMSLGDSAWNLVENVTPEAGALQPSVATDSEGRFAIPIPWGTHIEPGTDTTQYTLTRNDAGQYVAKPVRNNASESPRREPSSFQPPRPPNQTLHGRVLDPAGKPAPNVEVRPYVPDSANQTTAWRWAGRSASTNADGRFTINDVPANTSVQVLADTAPENGSPAWSEPVKADTGDLEIRLKPGGQLKILLPRTLAHAISGAILQTAELHDQRLDRMVLLNADDAAGTLTAQIARPGAYKLLLETAPELADLLDAPLTITEGHETVIDLRDAKLPPSINGAERWVNLKVLANDKPASGIQVGVYAERFAPEMVATWIHQWQTGNEATKAQALAKMRAAPSTTRTLAETLDPTVAAAILKEVSDLYNGMFPNDDLRAETVDLSDDAGQVRFKGQVGRTYILCAFAPGRWMTCQKITLAAAEDPVLKLTPTRPLVVHLPPTVTPPRAYVVSTGRADMYIKFVEPAGIERRALLRFLSGHYPPPGMRDLDLRENGPDEQFDDLPVGATIELTSVQNQHLPAPRIIKIDPGNTPIEVTAPK